LRPEFFFRRKVDLVIVTVGGHFLEVLLYQICANGIEAEGLLDYDLPPGGNHRCIWIVPWAVGRVLPSCTI